MKTLSIDIETFSSFDLKKCGAYRYVEADDFEIILFGYSIDGGAINVVDLVSGEKIPAEVLNALTDENIMKFAFNSQFERVCLSRHLGLPLGTYLSPKSWRCSMVWSAYCGLPLSLEDVGAVLGLERQKLTEGKELIRYFCGPNASGKRNLPTDSPDKWERFKEYNRRDVEVEMAVQARLSKFPVPDFVWDEFIRDQEMNDCGVLIDIELAKQAVMADTKSRDTLIAKMREITRLQNPNSIPQLKGWLADEGYDISSLSKKDIATAKAEITDKTVVRVLELRELTAKSSIKKYSAMLECAGAFNSMVHLPGEVPCVGYKCKTSTATKQNTLLKSASWSKTEPPIAFHFYMTSVFHKHCPNSVVLR